MAIKFRLPDDLRAKHDLPEWVEYDLDVMMLDEAIELEDLLGIDAIELRQRLSPGEGKKRDLRAWKFLIWSAVKRAGVDIPFAEFNLDLYALGISSTAAADEDPKAETADPSTLEKPSDEPNEPSETA